MSAELIEQARVFVARHRERQAQIEAALEVARELPVEQNYVIVIAGLAMKFEIVGNSVRNPARGRTEAVQRFTAEQAQHVAPQVQNGLGERGQALPLVRALEEELAGVLSNIEVFEGAIARMQAEQE